MERNEKQNEERQAFLLAEEEARGKQLAKWLLCLGVCGGSLLLRACCPQGAQAIAQCVFGVDSGSMEAAFSSLEEHDGARFDEAVEAFCSAFLPEN